MHAFIFDSCQGQCHSINNMTMQDY